MHINAYAYECILMHTYVFICHTRAYWLLYAYTSYCMQLVATDDIQTSVWATRMFKKKNMCQSSMVMRYSCIYVYVCVNIEYTYIYIYRWMDGWIDR